MVPCYGDALYYDPSNPGWSTSSAWSEDSGGPYDTDWVNGSLATFNFGAAGTHNVTLGSNIVLGGLSNIGLGTVQINGSGTRTIDFNGSSVSGTFALNTSINSTGNVTVNSGASLTSHGTASAAHVGTITNYGTTSLANANRLSSATNFVIHSGTVDYSAGTASTIGTMDLRGGQFRIGFPTGSTTVDITLSELKGTGGTIIVRWSNNANPVHTLRVNQESETVYAGSINGISSSAETTTYLKLVKEGLGTLTLSGTLSGMQQGVGVDGGILLINSTNTSFNNISSYEAITVAPFAALGGTGIISIAAGKSVVIENGGRLIAGGYGSVGTTTYSLGDSAALAVTGLLRHRRSRGPIPTR